MAASDIEREVAEAIARLEGRGGAGGSRLLVTAGPTCEDIDAVRFITNRSSGRMGWALVETAVERGWRVLLVAGPTAMEPPTGCACVRVRSAADMLHAVLAGFPWCRGLIMAAAVADYTPATVIAGKRRKQAGDWVLRLERTVDILAQVKKHPARAGKVVVGFSLDARMHLHAAREKLRAKGLDLVVANTAAAFAARESVACLVGADGGETDLGALSKVRLAGVILDAVERLFVLDRPREGD